MEQLLVQITVPALLITSIILRRLNIPIDSTHYRQLLVMLLFCLLLQFISPTDTLPLLIMGASILIIIWALPTYYFGIIILLIGHTLLQTRNRSIYVIGMLVLLCMIIISYVGVYQFTTPNVSSYKITAADEISMEIFACILGIVLAVNDKSSSIIAAVVLMIAMLVIGMVHSRNAAMWIGVIGILIFTTFTILNRHTAAVSGGFSGYIPIALIFIQLIIMLSYVDVDNTPLFKLQSTQSQLPPQIVSMAMVSILVLAGMYTIQDSLHADRGMNKDAALLLFVVIMNMMILYIVFNTCKDIIT